MSNRSILVTGAAGFIGYHVSQKLLADGWSIIGVDSLNGYYDPALKQDRLKLLLDNPGFKFVKLDLADRGEVERLFAETRPPIVVHLAAQAGVRYSLENPHAYVDANLAGFMNVLEGCRHTGCEHLIFASSSSVYGANTKIPFSVRDNVDHPISLYAASKKSNELMAHAYSHLYGIPTTGLRFFTVYGPWYRPDMAMFKFAQAMTTGQPISLYNNGNMRRDFTYVDDVTEVIGRLILRPPRGNPSWSGDNPDPSSSSAPWKIYNIGNSRPEDLESIVALLERGLNLTAERKLLPMQPGDVPATCADADDLFEDVGYVPRVTIQEGIPQFVSWYREYFNV